MKSRSLLFLRLLGVLTIGCHGAEDDGSTSDQALDVGEDTDVQAISATPRGPVTWGIGGASNFDARGCMQLLGAKALRLQRRWVPRSRARRA